MTTTPGAPSPPDESSPIAPVWHTVAVLVFLFAIAGLSAWRGSLAPVGNVSGNARLLSYAVVVAWEWLTVAFIAWGVRRRGYSLSAMIKGQWPRAGAFFRDLGISLAFLIGSNLILSLIQLALKSRANQAVRNLLPETGVEMAVWVLVAATAGFCEETIFRGYLQQQIGRFTHSAAAGIVFQAVVFGICHGYQGAKQMITISVYGGLFGLLALRMNSLRPGMLAHFIQDSAGGLALRWALKKMGRG